MATKLNTFPTNTRNSKYDWDNWFNGEIWALTEGEDFEVSAHSFRGALQAAKKLRNIEVRTAKQVEGDKVTIIVQAVVDTEPTDAAPVEVKSENDKDKAAKREAANAKRRAQRAAKKAEPNEKVARQTPAEAKAANEAQDSE